MDYGVKLILFVGIGIAWGLLLIYGLRPDYGAAITIVPAWCWLVVGISFLCAMRLRHWRISLLCLVSWATFCCLYVEEPVSVVRGMVRPPSRVKSAGVLRVVAANCGGGLRAVLAELKDLDADIILLQESPIEPDLRAAVTNLWVSGGSSSYEYETCILARGRLMRISGGGQRVFYVGAQTALDDGIRVDVVSLHLAPAPAQFDLWNPVCWRVQYQHRLHQMEQIRAVVAALHPHRPMIIGGDFNAPQGDKIYSALPRRLYDTFAKNGKGIGNTLINDFPVLRIDQIWVSRHFETVQSFTQRSRFSDHRIVVSDVRYKYSD